VAVGGLGGVWLVRRLRLELSLLWSLWNVWGAKVKSYWGGWSVGDVKHTEVAEWLAGLEMNGGWSLGATSKRCARQILNSIFRGVVRDRRISFNPVEGVPMPKKTRAAKTYLVRE